MAVSIYQFLIQGYTPAQNYQKVIKHTSIIAVCKYLCVLIEVL